MDHDATLIKGNPDLPAVVFIHGMGMDKTIWESPDESRILGGRFPVSILVCREPAVEVVGEEARDRTSVKLSLGVPPKSLHTLFDDLKEQGFTVIAWSQERPAAEIKIAVSELEEVIAMHEAYCASGLILIGHSRGGLVARKYLAGTYRRVRCLVTLASPHRGSGMAQWAAYLSPLASVVSPFLSDAEKGTLAYAVKKIAGFLSSAAVKEMLPNSRFFSSLDDCRMKGVYYLSVAGRDPTLFCIYRTAIEEIQENGQVARRMRGQKVLAVPEVFERLIPERLFPEEMKKGRGDGLVSVESADLPWAHEHAVFDDNHAGVLFDTKARAHVMNFLKKVV